MSTYAMEIRRNALISALIEALAPTALIEKSDVPQRETEGLAVRKEIIFGRPRIPCEVEENGVKVLADLVNGQKTGYFLDQVKNRSLAIPYFKGARVLDLFCYSGAWSLVAAAHGATETIGVDTSQKALELAAASARLNNLDETKCKFLDRDVFTYARELVERGEKFDVVVLDPPALAKSKKDRLNALAAYRELNLRAMRLLGDDGILVTCSCSHNVSEEDFLNTLMHAAKDSRTDLLVLHRPLQPPDHPVHLATPETSYLKVFFLKKRVF
jgi:23S rRNA (cytosine1962-C5)-methyltransferase